ncbi:hypothetical protein KGO06_00990 [Patescibacteria group bacterium]|nr:hypothetical protein [Patescibacteria group bacterium]
MVAALILGAIILFFASPTATSMSKSSIPAGTYTALAQCIRDSGAVFFGAWWCPHCREQKESFGDAAELLPYIECSTPDGKGQTKACIDAKVNGYPTWRFADGTELKGAVPLQTLAAKTGCVLPDAPRAGVPE